MRDLTIIVADISSERFRAALELALAQAALGGEARVFLSGEAVGLIRQPIAGWTDAACEESGLPSLSDLYDEAVMAGVKIVACQSGLAMTGIEPADLDDRVEAGGMVSLLQSLGDGRLVAI